jgi:hypothetical protein
MSFVFSHFDERFLANKFVIDLLDAIHACIAEKEHYICETAWEIHETSRSPRDIAGTSHETFVMPCKDLGINLTEILRTFGIPV